MTGSFAHAGRPIGLVAFSNNIPDSC